MPSEEQNRQTCSVSFFPENCQTTIDVNDTLAGPSGLRALSNHQSQTGMASNRTNQSSFERYSGKSGRLWPIPVGKEVAIGIEKLITSLMSSSLGGYSDG